MAMIFAQGHTLHWSQRLLARRAWICNQALHAVAARALPHPIARLYLDILIPTLCPKIIGGLGIGLCHDLARPYTALEQHGGLRGRIVYTRQDRL